MPRAFQILQGGKTFNYRDGEVIDEQDVRYFFAQKGFSTVSVNVHARHAIVHLRKQGNDYCAKVSTSFGVGLMTKQEILWNKAVARLIVANTIFTVPQVLDVGEFSGNRVYYITDWIETDVIAQCPPSHQTVPPFSLSEELRVKICAMTQQIEALDISLPIPDESLQSLSHVEAFIEKTRRWLQNIPEKISDFDMVQRLFTIVESGAPTLRKTVRHGDVTPWHLQILPTGKILLFDGEHAHSHGVEGYDICYFIQRVYSVLQSPQTALEIFETLLENGHDQKKLQTVLASRAIGGYCDESLAPNPDYHYAREFGNWVLSL